MRIFKNKFFFIALAVAVFLTVLSTALAVTGRADLLRSAASTVTFPIRWVASKCADGVRGFGSYFGASKSLNEENESLRTALAAAEDREIDYAILEAENERLSAYLGIKSLHPAFTFEEGVVVDRSPEKYVSVFTLNRGSRHGIAVGMPVLTPEGLIGQVTEVGLNWCRVSTILSGGVSVGAYDARSGVMGVISGSVSNGVCTCVMEYLEPGDKPAEPETEPETDTGSETGGTESETYPDYGIDIRVGDLLVTAGVGAVYPSGLTVGRISAVTVDPYSRQVTATVVLSADFSRDLRFAAILTGTGGGQ